MTGNKPLFRGCWRCGAMAQEIEPSWYSCGRCGLIFWHEVSRRLDRMPLARQGRA